MQPPLASGKDGNIMVQTATVQPKVSQEQIVVGVVRYLRDEQQISHPTWKSVKRDDVIHTLQTLAKRQGKDLTSEAAVAMIDSFSGEGKALRTYPNKGNTNGRFWMFWVVVLAEDVKERTDRITRFDGIADGVLASLASLA